MKKTLALLIVFIPNLASALTFHSGSSGVFDFVVPEGVSYSGSTGEMFTTKDKYTSKYQTLNVQAGHNLLLDKDNLLRFKSRLSTGFDSYALDVNPYIRTSLELVSNIGNNDFIVLYGNLPVIGGKISERKAIDSKNPGLGYWSFATAKPWSDYKGVDFIKKSGVKYIHKF